MKPSLRVLKQHVLPALLCFAAAFGLMRTQFWTDVENRTIDARTRLRAHFDTLGPVDELALIAIDEISIHDNGRWPWDREVHGDLLQLLSLVRPSVVSWDILFPEASPADDFLARSLAMHHAVVLGAVSADAAEDGAVAEAPPDAQRLQPLERIEGDASRILASPAMLLPVAPLRQVADIGFVDTPPGSDGVRRTVPLVIRVGNRVYPSLALRTLMAYWLARPQDVTVRLGDAVVIDAPLARRRIPIDDTGAFTVNYRHNLSGFVRYGYSQTWVQLQNRYADHRPGPVPPLTGRILLVGQVADGLSDFGPTPFSPLTPLVLVHANVIENVLRQDYVTPVPPLLVWCAAWAVGVIGLVRLSTRTPLDQAVFAIGVPAVFIVASTLMWIDRSWLVPVVGPVLGFTALQVFMIGRRMLTEMHAKEQIRGMFGTYVSPELVSRLIAAGKPPELGGHQEEITAYFSDIESFSTFSEVLPPDRLVRLMNEYFTACTDIVQAEGGTLDKYIGDAVVAMFGAPVPLPDHAARAVVTALRVQARIAELRRKWAAEGGWPEMVTRMRTRIGLNSGPCTVGNVGSRSRFNYTMMGDNVNLAARMESGAKTWGVFTVCTEATRAACEAHAPGRVVFRPLGRIQVKGRAAAVPIHELVGLRETVDDATRELIAIFAAALERYEARDLDGARKLWEKSVGAEPGSLADDAAARHSPSRFYLDQCERLRATPLAAGWDGVIVMHDK